MRSAYFDLKTFISTLHFIMTPEQIKDLLIEWSIYNSQQQMAIELEYKEKFGEKKDENHWLNFLKEKLEIEEYWRKTGLT